MKTTDGIEFTEDKYPHSMITDKIINGNEPQSHKEHYKRRKDGIRRIVN